MPTTSPGTTPGRTVSDLGLPARAVTALTRAGITTTEQLAGLTRADLVAINGLGPGTVAAIRAVVPEPPGRIPAAGREEPPTVPAPDDEESPTAPRPPDYADLYRLGVRVGTAVVTLPVRLALRVLREPVRRLRHLVGR